MSKFDEPGGQTELCGYRGDGPRIRTKLQWINQSVHETDDCGGITVSNRQQ